MSAKEKAKHILAELKGHAPFTLFGAVLGIVFMLIFQKASPEVTENLFKVFHPGHVILSAMVTASMFKIHTIKKHIILIILVGYFGSIGIATLSDIIIPHFGGKFLGLTIPTHAHHHEDQPAADKEHELHDKEAHGAEENHAAHIHLGFIEEWYIVNPAAFLGIAIALFLPHTKFPHAAHVLVSTWATSSYLLMDIPQDLPLLTGLFGIFLILFIATWLPCCISDIVFPLLFVRSDIEVLSPCSNHSIHSHPHNDQSSTEKETS